MYLIFKTFCDTPAQDFLDTQVKRLNKGTATYISLVLTPLEVLQTAPDLTSFILSMYVLATPITFKANLQSLVILEVARNQALVLFTMWADNLCLSPFLTLLICTFGR